MNIGTSVQDPEQYIIRERRVVLRKRYTCQLAAHVDLFPTLPIRMYNNNLWIFWKAKVTHTIRGNKVSFLILQTLIARLQYIKEHS